VPARPPREVLAEFGTGPGDLRLLPGGQGTTWGAGEVVLKPVSYVAESEWVGSILWDLPEDGFRISRPVRSRAGSWTVAGWSAWSRVEGSHDVSSRWPDVFAAGAAFHAALRDVERPGFLDARRDFWSQGDRAAWDDDPPLVMNAELASIAEQFLAFRTPCQSPSQVVHGDLTGNVLFADPLAPAVIDFAPYWRPVEFAQAIVVADAIAWHHASPDITRFLTPSDDPRSMLARAAIFRLITSDRAVRGPAGEADPAASPGGPSRYLRANHEAHTRILAALRAM
jgi:uncharacterized protein (TIGR02569 family)